MHIVNEIVHEDFRCVDENNVAVSGIGLDDFIPALFNPSGAESPSGAVEFSELGKGNYRATFRPDMVGDWFLIVTNLEYFPWGKLQNIDVSSTQVELFGNKKVLTQISDNEFKEEWYSVDGVTKTMTFKITKVGNVETREPI